MNTLTPNRILQKGDEYRDNGAWKPVPANDYGLQIMFTKYAEVRRPTETPFVHGGAPAIKVSPPDTNPAAKSEVPLTPASKALAEKLAQSEKDIEASGLPTVVSRKAHIKGAMPTKPHAPEKLSKLPVHTKLPTSASIDYPHGAPTWNETSYDAEHGKGSYKAMLEGKGKLIPTLPPAPVGPLKPPIVELTVEAFVSKPIKTETEKAVAEIKAKAASTYAEIKFPAGAPRTIWTGRNGTFNSVAVNLHRTRGTDICAIIPQGKRGVAKNAVIEFPVSAIPQMIDFLQKQIL